jgi:NAD(P)H-flavin reductase
MSLYCDDVFSISESGYGRSEGEVSVYDMRGTVMDLAARLASGGGLDLSNASVMSCGPIPMLRAVAEWAKESGIPAQVSLEERMGCGYGACVGCTVEIKSTAPDAGEDAPRNTSQNTKIRRKICKDGPVFPAAMLTFDQYEQSL